MNLMSGIASPTCPASDFLAHESECREVLGPWLANLLDMAETAGWNRRTVASTVMFLAAQQMTGTANPER